MEGIKEAVEYGVIGILVLMSILSVGIAIERWLFFRSVDILSYNSKQKLEIDLTRGLHLIATVGSNAPYVGLLGTVLGIMLTFYTIGVQGFVSTKEIMVGLALALKATAVGLLVAIPSVVLYNLLLRKVRVLLALWEAKNGG
ncbi:MAG: TonB-system energizer ExbB [Aquificae bacterium]|nr:TonB-system energizer ExbB [Aquificota bacterium]